MDKNKALKILFNKFWSPSKGWQNNNISDQDFQYAKDAGIMFDPIYVEHDSYIQECKEQFNLIKKEQVVKAFINSLLTKELALRSALSSYACGQNIPNHKFSTYPNNYSSKFCAICDEKNIDKEVDLNVLNFERYKFGGVRHLNPIYIWFDLMLFSKEEINEPNAESIKLLSDIILKLKEESIKKLSDAEKSFKSIIKSNKNEREAIIATFGYCGILNIPNIKPFYLEYIPCIKREHSNYSKSDWPFPADLWLPKYSLNLNSIKYWFGDYIE